MLVSYVDGNWKKNARGDAEICLEVSDPDLPFRDAKKFLQCVVADPKDLISLRNQIMFFADELWGQPPSQTDLPSDAGTAFYAWTLLPCPEEPPQEDERPIFAHNVTYVPRRLTARDIRLVQKHMKHLDYRVWPKRVEDPSPLCTAFRWARLKDVGSENVAQCKST